MRIVSIVGSVPASIAVRVVSVDRVEVVGLVFLGLVLLSLGIIISLIPAMRIVSVVAMVPGAIPAWVVSVNLIEVVSLGLLSLVLIGSTGGSLIGGP